MRQGIIDLHFNDLRVDEDKAHLFRGEPIEHAGENRVDANALAASCGAGNQAMRHLGKIGNDGASVNVFAERQGDFGFAVHPILRFQQFTECDLHFAGISDFNTHGVFAGNRG